VKDILGTQNESMDLLDLTDSVKLVVGNQVDILDLLVTIETNTVSQALLNFFSCEILDKQKVADLDYLQHLSFF